MRAQMTVAIAGNKKNEKEKQDKSRGEDARNAKFTMWQHGKIQQAVASAQTLLLRRRQLGSPIGCSTPRGPADLANARGSATSTAARAAELLRRGAFATRAAARAALPVE